MDAQQFLSRRVSRLECHQRVRHVRVLGAVDHCSEPGRALGVLPTGHVFQVRRVSGEQNGHSTKRYPRPAAESGRTRRIVPASVVIGHEPIRVVE